MTSPALHRRSGIANATLILVFGSLGLLLAMFALMLALRGDNPLAPARAEPITLVFRCAAGIQPPTDRVVAAYRQQYPNVEIELDYQGSGTLLESIRVEHREQNAHSDLYLAADESYMRKGKEDGLLAEVIPVAMQYPVIAVKKGNPQGIRSFRDLLRDDVEIAIADPEGAAIGRVLKTIAEHEGVWEQILAKRKVMVTKVPELVSLMKIGNDIDAALIWNATVDQVEELEGIDFPAAKLGASQISISVVAGCEQPTAALHFARFFASRDQGQPHFVAAHYQPVEADLWQDHPSVKLYAGSMFQAGVDETIRRFEQREGVTVDRIYNGCGILVAQMQAGGKPEAYLSCDSSYMDQVADRFRDQSVISENDIVILVKRGNPHGVTQLADLTQGLSVGVCHPTDSALGALTKRLLEAQNLGQIYDDPGLMVATGPMLMNAIATGAQGGLDAALVYRSNVLSNPENLERVEIIEIEQDERRLATATQPWAIAKETDHARLLGRLYEAIVSDESRRAFTSAGFRWLSPSATSDE